MKLILYLVGSNFSRREAFKHIVNGKIRVNGVCITDTGFSVNEERDRIFFENKRIRSVNNKFYFILNKPVGILSSTKPFKDFIHVTELIKETRKHRLFLAGRLDVNSEGLLIITNDGRFAQIIMHPRHRIPKRYRVKIKGKVDDSDIARIRAGLVIDGTKIKPVIIDGIKKLKRNSWIDLTIYQGKKRVVRRIFEKLNKNVIRLIRTCIDGIDITGLESGQYRKLTYKEIESIYKRYG